MSVSKWAWREECDNDYCTGDCDICPKKYESEEDEIEKAPTIERGDDNDTLD